MKKGQIAFFLNHSEIVSELYETELRTLEKNSCFHKLKC